LAAAYPKPKEIHYKIKFSVLILQNPLQEIFVPPPWHPPTFIDHYKTTFDQVFWYPHLLFNLLFFKNNYVNFFAQIRIIIFWIITVCCYLRICVHVHVTRFGDIWNSFPGFAWVLLRFIWDIARQKKYQIILMANKI
jgi:hypothetical protein